MSGNKLLKENTIRRFMKLANVGSLSDNFISEMGMKGSYKDEDEEELEEGAYKDEDEETLAEQEEEEELDLDMGDEEPVADDEGDMDMDMDMDMEMDDEDSPSELGSADISLTEEEAQLLIDLGERLGAAMDSESEEDLDVPDEEGLELDDMDVESEEAPEEMGEEEREEIMQEVLRRVTKRLLSSRRK